MSNLLSINWDKAPEGADRMSLIDGIPFWCKSDRFFSPSLLFEGVNWCAISEREETLIATRPAPPLTDEQVELLNEFIDEFGFSREMVDKFIEKRGGEHE